MPELQSKKNGKLILFDDDVLKDMSDLKAKDPNGMSYVKLVNTAVRVYIKSLKRKKSKK